MSRAYFFGNMYLSSIQQGIQAGHVITEMAVKYQRTPDVLNSQGNMFYDWAENYKTMILLNAGYGENILDLRDFFMVGNKDFPYAIFHESDEALDGAATCFGCILPAKIYKGAEAMRKIKRLQRDNDARLAWDIQKVLTVDLGVDSPMDIAYTKFEVELMERLGAFRLAS